MPVWKVSHAAIGANTNCWRHWQLEVLRQPMWCRVPSGPLKISCRDRDFFGFPPNLTSKPQIAEGRRYWKRRANQCAAVPSRGLCSFFIIYTSGFLADVSMLMSAVVRTMTAKVVVCLRKTIQMCKAWRSYFRMAYCRRRLPLPQLPPEC